VLKRFRRRCSYANVTATLALFVALGGSSYATLRLPKDSVGRRELRRNSVGTSELRTAAVRSKDIKDDSVGISDINRHVFDRVPIAIRSFRADIAETSLRADVAANSALLGGRAAESLELRCPEGTIFFAAACTETDQRSNDDFENAAKTCAQQSRRLPSPSQLIGFADDFRYGFGGDEWADDLTDFNNAILITGAGTVNSADTGTAHAFRCVAVPNNNRLLTRVRP
jgi:hypothetical protein